MDAPSTLPPVAEAAGGTSEDKLEPGIALCLSGGGYRAMLFHLGALWRLNDGGYLPKLNRVSSVSGGSITAGVLALAWPKLAFDAGGVAQNFAAEVIAPIRGLAGTTVDVWAILLGLIGPGRISDRVARSYRTHLFGDHTLQDLSDSGPRFVFNATNLQSGVLWRFSKPYMWDYRVGRVSNPRVSLATVVAASSAFPPFLSPLVLRLNPEDFVPNTGLDLQRPPFTSKVFLTDGGVYDNLGLETAWKRYKTILVSDGGGDMRAEERPNSDWPRLAYRVLSVIDNQVRSLRKRQVIAAYQADPANADYRKGSYWGIRSDITKYYVANALPCPVEQTTVLADVSTRLAAMDATLQKQIINWGFAICDAAMRSHVDPALPAPAGFPYPEAGVGTKRGG